MVTKLKNVSYLRCRTHCITHSKSSVVVQLPHTVFLHLKQSYPGFVLSAVCSYLTCLRFSALVFLRAVDSW